MIRMLFLSFVPILAATLPLGAAELRVSVFTPARGDAAAFRKLVASSVIGAPAGQLERLKGAFVLAKPKATPPVSLLTDSLAGKRVESGRSGNLNTLAFTDSSARKLQILVWNTGSTRNFAELVIPDAGRFFGKERVDMRLKLLTTDESEEQPSTNRGDYAILNGALNLGVPLPPESAALVELAPAGQLPADAAAGDDAAHVRDARTEAPVPPPERARNELNDPDFRRQRKSGMNGGVYVQFQENRFPRDGGISIDPDHPLAMRYLLMQSSGNIHVSFDARSRVKGKLTMRVNFMQRQKYLSIRKLEAAPGAVWQTFSASYPIPAGTTHVNCTIEGGPADVKGLGLVN